ncbi:MAG: hypothetical protein ACREIJ_13340, partial [Nitrospiraceae bacterium]
TNTTSVNGAIRFILIPPYKEDMRNMSRTVAVVVALHHRLPTMVEVMQDLVRKRWVTKRHPIQEQRAVCLRLSRLREDMWLERSRTGSATWRLR